MPTVIRRNVFETNSSSTHSISIERGAFTPASLPLDNGICKIYQGEFGWEQETYNDPATKASYLLTAARDNPSQRKMLTQCICDVCGLSPEEVELMDEPTGYIDHQSYGSTDEAFKDLESMKAFIFNSKSVLVTDNDNH